MVDSKQDNDGITKGEQEIKEMVQGRVVGTNKAIFLQTIAVVLSLVGIAIAFEHRVTIVEERTRVEAQQRVAADTVMLRLIEKLQDSNATALQNQARVITLLDVIDKRHSLVDARKAAKK